MHGTSGEKAPPARTDSGGGRHVAVASNGDVYVTLEGTKPSPEKVMSGAARTVKGTSFVVLRDTSHDGPADIVQRVQGIGNTGIGLFNGHVYVDEGTRIVRYARADSQLVPNGKPRYVTGLRNGMGLTFGPDGRLYATQHRRDQLHDNWPNVLPSTKYQAENPGEELMQVDEHDDYGWPYGYYAMDEKKLVTAPEYGGDGKKTDRCTGKKNPIATYPGHWAPMALVLYNSDNLPAKYRAGFPGMPPKQVQAGTAKHRPTGIAAGPDGALYVTDDLGGRVYRITYNTSKIEAPSARDRGRRCSSSDGRSLLTRRTLRRQAGGPARGTVLDLCRDHAATMAVPTLDRTSWRERGEPCA